MNSTTLKKLEKLYEELTHLEEVFKENYITQKQRSREIEQEYKNEAGDTVTVKEFHIWEELYHHPKGRASNAGQFLSEKYPQIFELEDQLEAKKKEVQEYELKEFGFQGNQMKFIDLIHIIDELITFKLQKK